MCICYQHSELTARESLKVPIVKCCRLTMTKNLPVTNELAKSYYQIFCSKINRHTKKQILFVGKIACCLFIVYLFIQYYVSINIIQKTKLITRDVSGQKFIINWVSSISQVVKSLKTGFNFFFFFSSNTDRNQNGVYI